MPEYRTQFSFVIADLTDEERSWLASFVTSADQHPDPELANDQLTSLLTNPDHIGFTAAIEDDGRSLRVWAGEFGTPQDAANLAQEFLARFRPGGTIGFEWADTCLRPLPDAYGGGAVHVTADGQRWMSSGQWLAAQQRAGRAPRRARRAVSEPGDQPLWTREDGYHVVVCTDEPGRTWVLARTLDGDRNPFFFDQDGAEHIAAAVNDTVEGTTATAAEWFAADTVTGDDEFDVIVKALHDRDDTEPPPGDEEA